MPKRWVMLWTVVGALRGGTAQADEARSPSSTSAGLPNEDITGAFLPTEPSESQQGFGVGTGGPMKARKDGPVVKLVKHVVKGQLPEAIVKRYVKRSIAKISYCYEKELPATPKLKGAGKATYRIDEAGYVKEVKMTGLRSSNVNDCIQHVLAGIQYPKPKAGDVNVTLSLSFAPNGYRAPATK